MEHERFLLAVAVFFPMAAGIVSYLTGRKSKKLRDMAVSLTTVAEFALLAVIVAQYGAEGGFYTIPGVCGFGLHFTVDGFRALYGAVAAFMWMMTSLFSEEYFAHYRNRNRYYLFQLITLGATEAVFLSADLYTTFLFFEIMSFASYVWVAQDERKESLRAAATYLAVAVIGGLVMLMGLFLLYDQVGTLTISELYDACQGKNVYPAAFCLFFGFGAKAGAFPLHIWLPKAHPVAPAPASALLSGILTKTGVFGILVISCQILFHDPVWGTFVLAAGVLTMAVGAVLALFSIDFKRTLACSSVSQIGFILTGIGMQGLLGEENALAVQGSFLHMMNHSLFKLVLFMTAGVIYMNLHKLDLNDIRGFGRKKPLLMGIYLCGALGIGGIPLFSGYVSKTLIHESIVEYMELLKEGAVTPALLGAGDMKLIEWVFLISGGFTVAYMCKLFFAVFIEKNSDSAVQAKYDAMGGNYMSKKSAFALTASAVLFPIMGILPHMTMDRAAEFVKGFFRLEHIHEVSYFSFVNLKGGLTSIAVGAVVYLVIGRLWMIRKEENGDTTYVNYWPKVLDLEDYLYRPVLLKALPSICGAVCFVLDHMVDFIARILPAAGSVEASFFDTIVDTIVVFLRKTIYKDSPQPQELLEGNALTFRLGSLMNRVVEILNKTAWRDRPNEKDYTHQYALVYTSFKENTSLIGRSLSYGLILFCVGLLATLVYLLLVLAG